MIICHNYCANKRRFKDRFVPLKMSYPTDACMRAFRKFWPTVFLYLTNFQVEYFLILYSSYYWLFIFLFGRWSSSFLGLIVAFSTKGEKWRWVIYPFQSGFTMRAIWSTLCDPIDFFDWPLCLCSRWTSGIYRLPTEPLE